MTLHFPINEEKDIKNSSPSISQLSIFAGADYLVTVHQGDHKIACRHVQVMQQKTYNKEIL